MNSLAQKYPHLEVSVLKLSEVFKDNPTKRIDAEYFKREYVEMLDFIKQKEFIQLKDTDIIIKHPAEIKREYVEKGVWFIRVQNIKPLNLDTENKVFISFGDASILYKNSIQESDILMNRTGSCGDCVLYLEKKKAIASSHVFIIRNTFFNQAFLSVFFNTRFGYIQIQRGKYGSVQPEIAPYYLKNIYVPLLPLSFQEQIETLVKRAHAVLEQSKALYKSAQDLLSSQLGLDSKGLIDNLSNSNHTIKTLKESFLKTGRLDAEYYQEKYERIEQQLKSYGFVLLEEICSLINYGSVPTSPYSENDEAIPYIKGLNLKHLQISGKLDRLINTERLHSKFFVQENDIIISQMGTVGDVGIVSKEQEGYIFASFTIRIRLKKSQNFNPFFIALYIQHIAKRWYLHRNIAQASVRQNTDLPTIRNLYIPKIPQNIQEHIAKHLQKSFVLRQQAYKELEKAKVEVERACAGGGGEISLLNAA
ncbi:restriction endonuclease subunit S [Helicobacter suis]|uniref:restriction endonuclease subunit S n=1 Tax=Helicobacter suis TaxID=104628 RepID=UPI001967CDAA|nr:restriction endonuclease subunit S [Helicobacter suis]